MERSHRLVAGMECWLLRPAGGGGWLRHVDGTARQLRLHQY